MNELALFAGVGGGLLGTHQLGINPVCAVERNEHRRLVLMRRQNERHLPSFPIWDDICNFRGKCWRGTVDFISGGFPCQAFSSAARGRNNAENLWPHMRRVVGEICPAYVFAENVAAKPIEDAARDLCSMGYKVQIVSLSAKDLGADHDRERFWLLAYADDKSQLRSTINAKMAIMPKFCEGIWESFPGKSRASNGLASRMDRFEACGNGQVSIVAAAALWSLANA